MRLCFVVAALSCIAFLVRDAISDHAQRMVRQQLFAPPGAAGKEPFVITEAGLATAMAFAENAARWDRHNARLAMLLGQACLQRAALSDSSDTQGRWRDAAAKWFLLARWACPLGRGFPKPVEEAAGGSKTLAERTCCTV